MKLEPPECKSPDESRGSETEKPAQWRVLVLLRIHKWQHIPVFAPDEHAPIGW